MMAAGDMERSPIRDYYITERLREFIMCRKQARVSSEWDCNIICPVGGREIAMGLN